MQEGQKSEDFQKFHGNEITWKRKEIFRERERVLLIEIGRKEGFLERGLFGEKREMGHEEGDDMRVAEAVTESMASFLVFLEEKIKLNFQSAICKPY